MKKDNSPVRPTCPEINNASSSIDSIVGYLSEQIVELEALQKGLENLRLENSDLRAWGNSEYDRAEQLEHELGQYVKEVELLKSEVREMNEELKKLDDLNMTLMKQAFADV